MKKGIDEKIHEIVDYITSKPASEITLDEYTILRDVRTIESEDENRERMEKLMSMVASGGFAPAEQK